MKISSEDYQRLMGKKKPKSNKYGAKRKEYSGHSYDSTAEADYAAKLDWKIKAGHIVRYEIQPIVDLSINGMPWRTWKIDFLVWITDTEYEYHEVKGVETVDFKMKRDAFLILYPNETLKIIKK